MCFCVQCFRVLKQWEKMVSKFASFAALCFSHIAWAVATDAPATAPAAMPDKTVQVNQAGKVAALLRQCRQLYPASYCQKLYGSSAPVGDSVGDSGQKREAGPPAAAALAPTDEGNTTGQAAGKQGQREGGGEAEDGAGECGAEGDAEEGGRSLEMDTRGELAFWAAKDELRRMAATLLRWPALQPGLAVPPPLPAGAPPLLCIHCVHLAPYFPPLVLTSRPSLLFLTRHPLPDARCLAPTA